MYKDICHNNFEFNIKLISFRMKTSFNSTLSEKRMLNTNTKVLHLITKY